MRNPTKFILNNIPLLAQTCDIPELLEGETLASKDAIENEGDAVGDVQAVNQSLSHADNITLL